MPIPEDRFTSTVSGAAAYEAYRSGGSYASDRYDAYDAMADAYDDKWTEAVQQQLDELCQPIERETWARLEALDAGAPDEPHPWTWERHLVGILQDEDEGGEDALREELEEVFRDEAEDLARDRLQDDGPCCNDYYCPCH